jgi:uncharacterized surface protein with fasciclin (FAS1) repeats
MKTRIRIILFLVCLAFLGGMSCRKDSTTGALSGPGTETLLNHLQNNYAFSLFYHALHRTGLDKQLNGKTAYTLLVIDNDAFDRDSISGTDSLDRMDTAVLRKWMAYHIVPGAVRVADVAQAVNNPYSSISGLPLWFSRPVPGGSQLQKDFAHILHINGDTVNNSDIIASDGVIQVLNRPLQLPVSSVQDYLTGHSQYSELVTGLKNFGYWDQLAGTGPYTVFAPDNSSFDGISVKPDSLGRLDTARFQKNLFGIYVLAPGRLFLTDFYDIGIGQSNGSYVTPNGAYYLSNGSLTDVGNDPVSQKPIPPANWTATNIITMNGVIQCLHGVLLTPGQTKK